MHTSVADPFDHDDVANDEFSTQMRLLVEHTCARDDDPHRAAMLARKRVEMLQEQRQLRSWRCEPWQDQKASETV